MFERLRADFHLLNYNFSALSSRLVWKPSDSFQPLYDSLRQHFIFASLYKLRSLIELLLQMDKDTGRSLFVISLPALLKLRAKQATDCCADLSLSLDLDALESTTKTISWFKWGLALSSQWAAASVESLLDPKNLLQPAIVHLSAVSLCLALGIQTLQKCRYKNHKQQVFQL